MFLNLAARVDGSTSIAALSRMGVMRRGPVCVVLLDGKQSAPEKQGYDSQQGWGRKIGRSSVFLVSFFPLSTMLIW